MIYFRHILYKHILDEIICSPLISEDPAEKVQRLVTSSAEAVKSLTKKAELMGLDLKRMEEIEAQEDNLNEV